MNLSGKKTYITSTIGGILLFGSWQKWWLLPSEFSSALTLAAICFLRSGVSKTQTDK